MRIIGVTGPRQLSSADMRRVEWELLELLPGTELHVGDARGVDAEARRAAEILGLQLCVHHTENHNVAPIAARLQERSKRLVEALRETGGILHGWPNKPCPPGLTPMRWQGSGTWGTLYYAWTCGVPIELHPLSDLELPHWCQVQQTTLF